VFYNHKGEDQGVIVIIDDISKTELLQDTFSRYLSPQMLEQILAEKQRPSLRSDRRQLSVVFADLRNFTRFAESRQPEEVVEVLNQYLDVMVNIIFEYQGTLDKFLGDGLLALFGTPLPQADHPCRAVQAALAIQDAIRTLNAQRCRRGQMTLDLGIGINSGEAIVGNIGSDRRMEYTVIGDMVNVAQRIQTRARGGDVLISDTTLAHVRDLVAVHATIEERIRGRQQPVWVHRIGWRPSGAGETT
jgi:adenylate cyclase